MKVQVSTTIRLDHTQRKVAQIKAAAADAAWRTASSMLELARSRVHRAKEPHGEGTSVHDSLQIVGRKGDAKLKVGSVGAHKGRPVALFLENGTSHSHAYPYLRPAATLGKQKLEQDSKAGIRAVTD